MPLFQLAALSAIGNIVVDFSKRRSIFIQCGGLQQLVQLSKSMDSDLTVNALGALRNLVFLADYTCKESIFGELTASLLASLVCGNDSIILMAVQDISFRIFLTMVVTYLCMQSIVDFVYLQIRSLLSRSKLLPCSAILLMDVWTLLNLYLLKMVLY